jgi:hypothetical protein
MPAFSKRQRRFMGAELGRAKRNQKTQTGMSIGKLREFASTAEKGLPDRRRGPKHGR